MVILTIVGTRPEAIKMAPVLARLSAAGSAVRSVMASTGQHRGLLDQVFDLFGIAPDYDLAVMQADQTLSGLTAQLFAGIDRVVGEVRPDWILAQGDTTSVLVAGLVAYYHEIKFGHVEAGLRTGDRRRPFPEEVNRRVADLVADAHFAPTERAGRTLLDEGCPADGVLVVGNTVIDALQEIAGRPYDWSGGPLREVAGDGRIVLVTAHRRESFGGPIREICLAVRDLARAFGPEGTRFVYPVHPNPNVRGVASEILGGEPSVTLLEPLDYLSLVHLMKRATLILTDSGGIQEEAPALGVPVLVARDATERPEGVEAGVARLVGTRRGPIVSEASRLLRDSATHAAMARACNPYGDGRAAARIVDHLLGRKETAPLALGRGGEIPEG